MTQRHSSTGRAWLRLLSFCLTVSCAAQTTHPGLAAQGTLHRPDLSQPAVQWAASAAAHEEKVINYNTDQPLRYKVRKVDSKGETVRELVETRDGVLQRLLERDGHPLTADENNAEQQRLRDVLEHPEDFFRRVHRDQGAHIYAVELLRSMPKAMTWTYAPGQPQLPGASGPLVVLDFQPDPNFKPPSLVTEALTGIAGRIWIDADTHYLVRIDGRILHPVDFGWGGVLARIREGGTVQLDQARVGPRWLYSHLSEHLYIREILIHTVREEAEVNATDIETLPASISYKEGVSLLLSIPVRTQ